MTEPIPAFIIFLAGLFAFAWWISCRSPAARTTSGPDQTDQWTTPLYLRSNVAVFNGTTAVTPSYPDQPWSLATYYAE